MAMNPANRVTIERSQKARKAGKTWEGIVARGEMPKPKMNATEADYGEVLRSDPTVAWLEYEAVTLKLGDDCRYTPDWVVLRIDGTIEMHEVKGFWRDDAMVKIKVAARRFPFRFYSARRRPKKAGGGYEIREFRP